MQIANTIKMIEWSTRWIETLEWAVSGCSDEEVRKLFHDTTPSRSTG